MNLSKAQGAGCLQHGTVRNHPGLRDVDNRFPSTQRVQGRVCCSSTVMELPGSKDALDEERVCAHKF